MKDGAILEAYDLQDGHTVHLVATPERSVERESQDDVNSTSRAVGAATATTATDPMQASRNRLRRLIDWIDDSDNEGSEMDGERGGIPRPQPVLRQQSARPGLTGDALNIAVLRDALADINGRQQEQPAAAGSARPQGQRLPQFREFFGNLDDSATNLAVEMGLAPPSSNNPAALDLDHITQGIMTVRTVLSTVATEAPAQEAELLSIDVDAAAVEELGPQTPPSSPGRTPRGRRRFFVGQWIDVKDTVNQWLESTVMDIANDKVLVHYHGWPTRWDEWLDFDSDRIAAFRTRTQHTMNPRQMSPIPSTRLQNAPRVGSSDVRDMVSQLRDLMHEILPQMDRFADLCEAQARDERQSYNSEDDPHDVHIDDFESEGGGLPSPGTPREGWEHRDDISEMAHLIAPIFDRVGRMFVDSARCLDPLLRPELQATSQRQQHRLSTLRGRRSASSLQRQATLARVREMEHQDTSLSIRDLIATAPQRPTDTASRRSIDVHIHAIVSPASLSSFAALRNNGDGGATRRGIAPSIPREPDHEAFDEAFGMPSIRQPQGGESDGRAILNDDNDDIGVDEDRYESRIPLLGGFRRDDDSDGSQRRRTVEENLDEFLADDFFGPSYDHPSTPAARAGGRGHVSMSTSSQYSSIPSPISDHSSVTGHGRSLIPEVAEAEEREEMRARDHDAGSDTPQANTAAQGLEGDTARVSTASSASSNAGFPTFLEVMRRTLSGVRNLSFSHNNNRDRGRNQDPDQVDGPVQNLSASSSASSLPSLSPREGRGVRQSYGDSHASEVDEDLDQLD